MKIYKLEVIRNEHTLHDKIFFHKGNAIQAGKDWIRDSGNYCAKYSDYDVEVVEENSAIWGQVTRLVYKIDPYELVVNIYEIETGDELK